MAKGESFRPAKRPRRRLASADGSSSDHLVHPPRKSPRLRLKAAGPPPISDLDNDLLEQIFLRLPNPRSICLCKSVCKLWNSIVSHPSFNRRFVSHHSSRTQSNHPPPPLLLLSDEDNPLSSFLSFLPVPAEFRSQFVIWDSFKDLILCGFREELYRLFLICNPITKQWAALPLSPELDTFVFRLTEVKLVCKEVNIPGDYQAFNYSEYRFSVLIGYEACTMMFSGTELHAFCSDDRKWSRRKGHRLPPNEAVALNGKLYWSELFWSDLIREGLRRWDPFRLSSPPTILQDFFYCKRRRAYRISSSNGALYVVLPVLKDGDTSDCYPPPRLRRPEDVLKVWRWEEGDVTWSRCYDALSLETLRKNSGPEAEGLEIVSVLAQHPEKPEIFFLKCCYGGGGAAEKEAVVFSCDFAARKLEFVAGRVRYGALDRWMVFWPPASCFGTAIHGYDELVALYGGRRCEDLFVEVEEEEI